MQKIAFLAVIQVFSVVAFADIIDEVRCQEIAFSQSAERRDIESFRSFIDDDARFVGSTVARGPEEIVAAWQPFFAVDGPAIKWRPQFVEVLHDGKLALTRGPYRMTAKDPEGNRVEDWGTFNSIWRKTTDGEWRVVFDAGSRASTAPDEETRSLLDDEYAC